MTFCYLQAREEIVYGDSLFYRMVSHGESRILKVTLRKRANQNFYRAWKKFFMTAPPNILSKRRLFYASPI